MHANMDNMNTKTCAYLCAIKRTTSYCGINLTFISTSVLTSLCCLELGPKILFSTNEKNVIFVFIIEAICLMESLFYNFAETRETAVGII